MPVRRTLERFGLRTGDTVLELGPGPGYYTAEASMMVGAAGRILCLDLQPEMLDMLRARLDEKGVRNAPGGGGRLRLPLADGWWTRRFRDGAREIPDRPGALRELPVLKPGGTLVHGDADGPGLRVPGTLRICAASRGSRRPAAGRVPGTRCRSAGREPGLIAQTAAPRPHVVHPTHPPR
jgi:ubiquinone/menaquinone biosynthesis C-methylase UbiE